MNRPVASLSLDLDNLWSYMKTAGIDGWQDFPTYLDTAVPRILETLSRHGLTITFFVVGQDAALARNHAALAMIAAAGHEIANHSYHHEAWLSRKSPEAMNAELEAAEEAIGTATGRRTLGFRGPSFCLSTPLLEVLAERGYTYDASTLPTFLGPMARGYYFLRSDLSREERRKRSLLFGSLADGLRPIAPYAWSLRGGALLEIPVTTIPLVRSPFHLTYLAFLAGVSDAAAHAYWRMAMVACRMAGIGPSLLLHPLDFMGADDLGVLERFPGMKLPASRKLALVDRVLGDFAARHQVLTMGAFAGHVRRGAEPRMRRPAFEADAASLSA